jgi:uncharacterized membrane protein YeaQ/YmgE (transglycosylase-associated protein family)
MAGKSHWNGVLLGIAFGVLAAAAATATSLQPILGFVTSILTSISDWLITQEWLPQFFKDMETANLNYIIAGLIGAIIGLWTEYK